MPKPFLKLTIPGVTVFIVAVTLGLANGLYMALGVEPPGSVELLRVVLFIWSIGWWTQTDSRASGFQWPLDMGYFLYITMPFLLFYYLFKTRGFRAFLPIAAYALTYLLALSIGVAIEMAMGGNPTSVNDS